MDNFVHFLPNLFSTLFKTGRCDLYLRFNLNEQTGLMTSDFLESAAHILMILVSYYYSTYLGEVIQSYSKYHP